MNRLILALVLLLALTACNSDSNGKKCLTPAERERIANDFIPRNDHLLGLPDCGEELPPPEEEPKDCGKHGQHNVRDCPPR